MIRSLGIAATIVALMSASAWLGWTLRAARPSNLVVAKERTSELPTIEDIQRRVGAVPDGKLGTETQAKWERALTEKITNTD